MTKTIYKKASLKSNWMHQFCLCFCVAHYEKRDLSLRGVANVCLPWDTIGTKLVSLTQNSLKESKITQENLYLLFSIFFYTVLFTQFYIYLKCLLQHFSSKNMHRVVLSKQSPIYWAAGQVCVFCNMYWIKCNHRSYIYPVLVGFIENK